MNEWKRFAGDRRGGMIERVALIAGAVALVSIGSARYLERAANDGSLEQIAFWKSRKAPGIDYTPTATIRGQGGSVRGPAGAVLIDPCTGKPR